MGFLLGLIGIITAIGVWYWRLKVTAQAAREIGSVAKTASNLPRRLKFKREAGKRGLEIVDDPREAAVLMMREIAEAAETPSDAHRDTLVTRAMGMFRLNHEQAQALLIHADWMARSLPRADVVMRKMSKKVVAAVGQKEGAELAEALEDIAMVDGAPTAAQAELIGIFLRMNAQREP